MKPMLFYALLVFFLIAIDCNAQKQGSFTWTFGPGQTGADYYNKAEYCVKYENKIKYYTKAIKHNYSPLYAAFHGRAIAKHFLKQYEEAIEDYEMAISLEPNDYLMHFNLGWAKNDIGKHDEALAHYNDAIKINSMVSMVYNNRGITKKNLGRHTEAVEDFNYALKLEPDFAKAYHNRGIAKQELGNLEDAIKDYTRSIQLNTEITYASYHARGYAHFLAGNYTKAVSDWESMKKNAPKGFNPDNDYSAEAQQRLNKKDYKEDNYRESGSASEFFQKASEANDARKSIELYTKAINKGYKPVEDAYFNRSLGYYSSGMNKEAIDDLDKAIQIKPLYEKAYFMRGTIQSKLGNHEESLEDMMKAIKIKPDFWMAYINRGWARYKLGDYSGCISDCDIALKNVKEDEDKAILYGNRGLAKAKQGELQKALTDFNKALELKTSAPWEVYNGRGYVYSKIGETQKALQDWESMKKVAPSDYEPDFTYLSNNKVPTKQESATQTKSEQNTHSMYPKRLALVVGTADYRNLPALANPLQDMKAMSVRLKELGFVVMEASDTDRTKLKKAVDDFHTKLKDYEVGLVFYAGHGIQYQGVNYIIPVDAVLTTPNTMEYECVSTDYILAGMEGAGNPVNFLILDACRNNPCEEKWGARGIKNTKGLTSNTRSPSGTLIVFATQPNNVAQDSGNNCPSNGIFTCELLKNLKKGSKIMDILMETRVGVMKSTNKMQVPWEHGSLTINFIF